MMIPLLAGLTALYPKSIYFKFKFKCSAMLFIFAYLFCLTMQVYKGSLFGTPVCVKVVPIDHHNPDDIKQVEREITALKYGSPPHPIKLIKQLAIQFIILHIKSVCGVFAGELLYRPKFGLDNTSSVFGACHMSN
jgi:hypothetical protein